MKTLAVVQARMASTRLPGKVMKIIGAKRALGWAVSAAMRASGVDLVIVATSVNKENDDIESWCNRQGIACFRGNEDDVLSRYCELINCYQPDNVVRLTGDCPLLDSKVISETIAIHEATGSVYTSNQWPPVWPDGLDCEVVKAHAILASGFEATDPIDRATVTQYVYRNQSRWPAASVPCPLPGLDKERWVLDSPEDYELLKLIVKSFPDDWEPNYVDIWHLLNKNPAWREINRQWYRNQRFFEDLAVQKLEPKTFERNQGHLKRAKKFIPNASQTYSKSCLSFPETDYPLFASHGSGAYLFDIDGNRYVDLVGALLPNILGYADPDVDRAIRSQLDKGICPSLATEIELELSELLSSLIPCAEMVRFGKNGSDATSAAIRLARAYTDLEHVGVIKSKTGGYHGWHDWSVYGTVNDVGVTHQPVRRFEPSVPTIEEELERQRYAAIIIDPENHSQSFLLSLKTLCQKAKTLLVFDEIRTGFRYSLGGYQEYIGVVPDLACFGKSMANGMPISALVGPKYLMERINDVGGPFWSGTFFGETLSIAAAIATINKIKKEGVIEYLYGLGNTLMLNVSGLIGDMDGLAIHGEPYRPLLSFYSDEYRRSFMRQMADEGVLIINSNNLCFAMGNNELERIITAYRKVLS